MPLPERENQPAGSADAVGGGGGGGMTPHVPPMGAVVGGVPRSPVLQPANGMRGGGVCGGEGPLCAAGAASPSL